MSVRMWRPAIQIRRGDDDTPTLVAGVLTVHCRPEDFEMMDRGGSFDLHITFVDPKTKEVIERKRVTV